MLVGTGIAHVADTLSIVERTTLVAHLLGSRLTWSGHSWHGRHSGHLGESHLLLHGHHRRHRVIGIELLEPRHHTRESTGAVGRELLTTLRMTAASHPIAAGTSTASSRGLESPVLWDEFTLLLLALESFIVGPLPVVEITSRASRGIDRLLGCGNSLWEALGRLLELGLRRRGLSLLRAKRVEEFVNKGGSVWFVSVKRRSVA